MTDGYQGTPHPRHEGWRYRLMLAYFRRTLAISENWIRFKQWLHIYPRRNHP